MYKVEKLNIKYWEQYISLRNQLSKCNTKISKKEFENKYELIKKQNSIIYVIMDKEKIIATCKLLIEIKIFDSVAHIEDVIVDKYYRHIGFGMNIIRFVISEAKKQKCYKIILNCKKELENFYNKSDFVTTGNAMSIFLT